MNLYIFFLIGFIILILILLLAKFIMNLYSNENFDFYTNCEDYRFGDVFYERLGEKKTEIENKILKLYPDSICSKYINNKKQKYDFTSLFKIINNYDYNNNYDNKTAVIHLRLGDILDDPFYENNKNLIHIKLYHNNPTDDQKYPIMINIIKNGKKIKRVDNPNYYLMSLNFYKNIINQLKNMNINNIILISGSHIKCNNYYLSTYVLKIIQKLFIDNKFNVKIHIANHPDSDILTVLNNKYFVPSKGGYSLLLEDLARMKKIKILK